MRLFDCFGLSKKMNSKNASLYIFYSNIDDFDIFCSLLGYVLEGFVFQDEYIIH